MVILCNAIVMASNTYPQQPWQRMLEQSDYLFIVIYVGEVVVKILGLGVKPYFAGEGSLSLYVCLPARLPACLPACLLVRLPARLLACLS